MVPYAIRKVNCVPTCMPRCMWQCWSAQPAAVGSPISSEGHCLASLHMTASASAFRKATNMLQVMLQRVHERISALLHAETKQ